MSKRLKGLVTITVLTMSILLSSSIVAFADTSASTIPSSVGTISDLQNALLAHMENRDTSFSIKYTGDSSTLITQLNSVINQAPKADEYLGISLTKEGATATGTNGNMNVTFSMGYVETKTQANYVDQETNQIISSIITPNMTPIQKVEAIQDYVCNNTTYDHSLQDISAYTALSDGETVCRGYSMLMYELLNKAGITVHIVEGTLDGVGHAWNIVELDGNWYQLDVTNDDANNSLVFFLKSDATLTSYGFGWNRTSNIPAVAVPVASSNYVYDQSASVTNNTIITNNTNATTAVTTAETTLVQADETTAENLVNALPDGYNKTCLLARLSIVTQGIPANTAVTKAETTLAQTDETTAQNLVNALPTGSSKTALLARLTIVNKEIPANTAVALAQKAETQANVNSASSLVNALPSGNIKTGLQQSLQTIQTSINATNLTNATNSVVKAETSLQQTDETTAQSLVTALPTGTAQTALQQRLTILEQTIVQNATTAVTKAETTLAQADETTAQNLVNALSTGSSKTALLARLAIVNKEIPANTAVALAQKTETQANVNSASSLVNALPSGNIKTGLQQSLQTIQTSINATNLTNATNAVVKAETSLLQADETTAQSLVTALPTGTAQTALLARLTIVNKEIPANTAVALAQKTETQANVNSASSLVNALPSGNIKTGLQQSLQTIQTSINSTKATTAAGK